MLGVLYTYFSGIRPYCIGGKNPVVLCCTTILHFVCVAVAICHCERCMKKSDHSTQEELRHILRMKAEERLHGSLFQNNTPPDESNDEVLRLLYELQIHTIELEVQNENLWQMKVENEIQLRRYSELYSDLYDSAPLGYCTISREDGTILKANLTAARLLEIERDELIGVRFGLLVSAEFREAVSRLINQDISNDTDAVQRKNLNISARLLRSWQEPFWVNLQARQSDSPRSCRLMFVDTDEQKQREELLEKLSMVASKTTNTIIITNAAGYVTWVNEAFTKLTEYSFSEAVGKKPGSFLQGKDTDWATILMMRNAIRQAEGFETEVLNYTKHTQPYWIHIKTDPLFDHDGALTGFIAIQTDITQRKQEELRLQFKAQLLNTIGESVIATDKEGKIIFWNAAAESLYGWSEEEAMGNIITEIIASHQSKDEAEEIFRLLVNGEQWSGKFKARRKDGREFVVMVTDIPLLDDNGNMYAIVGMSRPMAMYDSSSSPKNSLHDANKLLENESLRHSTNGEYITITTATQGNVVLNIRNDIAYLEGAKDYTRFVTHTGKHYITFGALGKWEERILPQGFIRVHRSSIVNIDAIRSWEYKDKIIVITLLNGTTINVSRGYKAHFLSTVK